MAEVGTVFKPGEKCPHSGIYEVIHDPNHADEHEVTCVHGKPFPPCNHCGHKVRFRLRYKARHIGDLDEFK
jgi:hypothetical protein